MNNKYLKIRKRYLPTAWPTYNYWVDMEKITGVKSSIFHVWEKDGIYTGIVEKDGLQKRGEWAYQHIIDNYKNNIELLRDLGNSYANKLIKECEKFALDPKIATLKEFSQFYKKSSNLYIDYYANNMLFWISADQIVIKKIDFLLAGYSEEDKKIIWDVMRLPTKLSFSNIEEIEFEKLLKIAETNSIKSEDFIEEAVIFSKKYIWFPFEYGGPEIYDPETVTKRIEEELVKKTKYEHHSEQKIIDQQKEITEKYSLSEEIIFHFKILQTLGLMQDDRKAINAQACYYVNKIILDKLSQIIELPSHELFLIEPSILDEFSESKDYPKLRDRIKKRNEMFVMYLDDNDSFILKEGKDECLEYLNTYDISINEESNNTEIKGKVAYPGKIIGTARVVKKSSECESLKDGDILITYMTTPDFVPYMRKVGAIVTEEGGITCHAAIVARELKKPCITGTGNIMSVIKDGDIIEVDANNGIVKIIK
jgi:phosphoenolpyruvate synthase/pyruvate phosphate dikinase